MRLLFVASIASLCFSPLVAKPHSALYSSPEWDEIRLEIDDLKHALHTTQVDLSLLDERSKKQESSLQKQGKDLKEGSSTSLQIATLEKRVLSLEKMLEKVVTDVRGISTSLTQISTHLDKVQGHLSSQEERLSEVGKLKTTLTSIAQAVRSPANVTASTDGKVHLVKSGDSLEKIARQHHISVETLRKLNHLSQDKILVGQTLRVADDTP